MLNAGTKVRIKLPEYIQVPTSITGLVMQTVKNESPYQGQEAIIMGEDYETGEKFDKEEQWFFVKFEDAASVPQFARNVLIAFPEHCLIPR